MSKINLVCASDNNFIQHCIIMLVSFCKLHNGSNIFILTEGLSKESINLLDIELEAYNCSLNIVCVDDNLITNLPMPKDLMLSHISVATYYRLFLATLLPDSISKVLYLDCDIIVKTDLNKLYTTDLKNYAIAGVTQYTGSDNLLRLGIEEKYGYFNAGVLLINLSYWRKNNIPHKLNVFIKKNYDKIKYHDQDILNAVLHKTRLTLNPRYNFLYPFFNRKFVQNIVTTPQEVDDYKSQIYYGQKTNEIVIHFTSSPKPWEEKCIHPLRKEYFLTANKTQKFKNISQPSKITSEYLIFIKKIKNILSFLKQ